MSKALTKARANLPNGAVFERVGDVLTNSAVVAQVFGKQHKHVLDSIDALLEQEPARCGPNFRLTSIQVQMPNGGTRTERAFEMTRDGLSLLAMGFTGKRALEWKLLYIEAFNRMEAELRARSAPRPEFNLKDRGHLLALSAELARELDGAQAKAEALQIEVAQLGTKAAAWSRIADTEGLITISGVAQENRVGINWLADFLEHDLKWCFRREQANGEKGPLIAYQAIIQKGWLVHKLVPYTRRDGSTGCADRTYFTPAGAAGLAALLEKHGKAA
jgi:Rha family phage regulatory protein